MISEELADGFHRYMEKHAAVYNDDIKRIQAFLRHPLPQSPVIFDVGTGPGLLPVALQRHLTTAVIIGVDSSLPMLTQSLENNTHIFESYHPFLATVEHLPFKNAIVDLAVSRFSVLYWDHPQQAFQEINRLLKPGGRLIIESLNPEYPWWRLWLMILGMFFKGASSQVLSYQKDAFKREYHLEQIEQSLVNASFTIIHRETQQNDWKTVVVAEKQC